ncbi:MAG: hypothetical protein GX660_08770 [Clostridiaceae bacterium]|nr:hypothetical protein [Clostridiaceae bacterium]
MAAFTLLVYSHLKTRKAYKPSDPSILLRRFYFTYVMFLVIFILPDLNKYSVLFNNASFLGLSEKATASLVLLGGSLVVYILIISDAHISEITIGNAKVSMLKEKYEEEIINHIDITNVLLDKISAENKIIQGLRKHSAGVLGRLDKEKEIFISQEYQILLSEYFGLQKEDIGVSVTDESDAEKIIKDFGLRSGEFSEMLYRMGQNEIYSINKKDLYYLFIPFSYRFEEFSEKVYVVLESDKPIIIEAETKIISNILMQFTDELLDLVLISEIIDEKH